MKKILTVSLFAIMAVSAANAEIASTKYVGDQMNLAEKIANKVTVVNAESTDATYPSAKAVQTALANVKEELSGGVGDLSTTVDGLVGDVATIQGQLSATGTTGKAIAAAQTQADKGVADAATAQAAAEAAQADANANADAISKLDTTYVSETEIAAYTNTAGMNSAIATAKSEAIAEAANAAKIYIDADELSASQTAQTTELQTYAETKASAAQTAAEAKVTELANGAVKTNTESIAAINNTTTGILAQAKSYADQKAGEASGSASQVASDLTTYIGKNDAAVAAAKQQADKGVADAATAQAAAEAAQADANANADAISKLDTTYVSETEIAAYTNTAGMNSAIATAKSEAIAEAANAAKIYIDADELSASQTAQTTELQTYAETKASAAQSAAEAKVTALSEGQVTTNKNNIATITTNLGGLNGIAIPDACTTGRCALVMNAGKAEWETINY